MVHSLKYVNLYFVFCEYSRHQTEILVYNAELVRHKKKFWKYYYVLGENTGNASVRVLLFYRESK